MSWPKPSSSVLVASCFVHDTVANFHFTYLCCLRACISPWHTILLNSFQPADRCVLHSIINATDIYRVTHPISLPGVFFLHSDLALWTLPLCLAPGPRES
ncbi:hypothetical protein BOTBODRAFT_313237 [Botryobasidium botryosum FD-172 SS1]|uniref:Uncharacterized protein n=1 Tax=Botryobasidium botryosum (strain FD-172 SS1) TaxID=930990 RepID=A0A067MXX5_BOTB1|nr:hypothetical protein BOTBODRAFT_313237 [Botryobasidium botryosum FD-172 SS1]